MSELLSAALKYADRRLKVFPIWPDTKQPLTANGHLDATTNDDQITQWWTAYPAANIGLSLADSGLVALDIDAYKTECAWDHYRGANIVDAGFIQKSPRGGLHYIFTADPTDTFVGSPCPGVDLKHRGYILLAPSTFEGKAYEVIRDDDLTALPSWLDNNVRKQSTGNLGLDLGSRSGDQRSDEVLISEIKAGQNWHINTLKLTGRYVQRGLSDVEIHTRTDSFTLPGYMQQDTRIEVQKMIDGARTKGFEAANLEDDGLSDDALALELGRLDFDQNARFVAEWGTWLFWKGKLWDKSKVEAFTRVREYLRHKTPSRERGEQNLRSASTVNSVERLARSNPLSYAIPEAFDSDLMLLGTPGGTVDLRSGKMRPAQREDMITMQTAVAPEPGTPTRFMQFLDEIKVCPDFLQRLAGYALTGSTKEEKVFFFYGSGANGKSKFVEQLQGIMGDYSRKAAISTFVDKAHSDHPTELAGLKGARLVTSSEIPAGKRWNEAVIKDLTGGDTISARLMRQDFFDFKPQLTLIIFGNTQPSLSSVDSAIRRRMVLVPFLASFEGNPDKQLGDKLRKEWPQILQWAIEGAVKWSHDGLKIPPDVLAASEAYLAEEDIIGQFIEDRLERLPKHSSYFLSMHDLTLQFEHWCGQNGHQTWTTRNFKKALKERGFEEGRQPNARGFINLKIK
jgi:putative DNA primase/helicase